MIVFWLLVSGLTLAGVAVLIVPLLRRRNAPSGDAPTTDEREIRLAVYRDRRREIEADRDAGRISADDAGRAIDELAGDAAANLPATPMPLAGSAHRWLAVALTVAVPVLAIALYAALGTPAMVGIDAELARGRADQADVAQAIDALTRRVREQPDDGQAWAMLGQARRVKGDFEGAAQAFAEASRLQPTDGRLLAEFAETIAASRQGDFKGQPEQLLEQALKVSPNEPKALALMGAAQYRLGRPERALVYLRTLLQGMDPQTDAARQIQMVADRISGEIGATAGSGPGPFAAGPATAAGTGDRAAPALDEAAIAASRISGRIDVSAELRGKVPAGATLFITARLPQGPRMPLAAVRQQAGAWPTGYAVSDAQAMSPQRRLSSAGEVVIEARISRSGNAIRESGDLIGTSAPVKPGTASVDVRIDQVVP